MRTSLAVGASPAATRLIWLILGASACLKCAAYFSVPFLSIFLARQTTLSLPVIGLVVGLQPLAALIGGFLGGHLSDRFRRPHILFASLLGSMGAYCGFFFAARCCANAGNSVFYFAALSLAAGWFSSLFWPNTQALIADLTAERHKSRIYRYRYVLTNIGGGLGPLLGVSFGFAAAATAFAATAACYGLFFVLFYSFIRSIDAVSITRSSGPHRSLAQSIKLLRQDKILMLLLLSAIFFGVGYAQIESNLSQFLYHSFSDGVQFFSWLIALNAVGVVALQPIATLCEKKWSAHIIMRLGAAIFSIGCLMIALFHGHKMAFVIGIFIITLGEVLVVPTLSVLVDEIAPEQLRGTYFGAATLRQLGPATGPLAGAVVFTHLGPAAVFIFMALMGALSAVFVTLTAKREYACNG